MPKEEKVELRSEIKNQRQKLREQAQQFRIEKVQLIKNAVDRKTRQLNKQVDALKARERKIEEKTENRIQRITTSEHAKAERSMQLQLNQFKKKMRDSAKVQLKVEQEKRKSRLARNTSGFSFHSTLH